MIFMRGTFACEPTAHSCSFWRNLGITYRDINFFFKCQIVYYDTIFKLPHVNLKFIINKGTKQRMKE